MSYTRLKYSAPLVFYRSPSPRGPLQLGLNMAEYIPKYNIYGMCSTGIEQCFYND